MFRLFIALLITIQLTACGKGSSDSGDSAVLTGQIMATGVQGLSYTTATQSGVTDISGHFKYKTGETVTFAVGNLVIAQNIPAKEFLTFLDFDPTQSSSLNSGAIEEGFTVHTPAENTVAASNIVSNITRFLEVIDDNKKADEKEGITIYDTTESTSESPNKDFVIKNLNIAYAALSSDIKVDFAITPTEFEKSPTVQDATSDKAKLVEINITNASWVNLLLDKICFHKDLNPSQKRDISYGEIKDADGEVTTKATIIFPDTVVANECLDPAPIQQALATEKNTKNEIDAQVLTQQKKVDDAEGVLASKTTAGDTAEITTAQKTFDNEKKALTLLENQQTELKSRAVEIKSMISIIANSKRTIGSIKTDDSKTYLVDQSKLFSSTISERIALSPFAFRFPASDTSIKSVVIFPITGTKNLQDIEVRSLNENIVSISNVNIESKSIEFFATGNAGEETEIVVNFKLSGDYRWFKKTVRVILK